MTEARFQQVQSPQMQMRPEMRQVLRIEQANLLDMSEDEFRRLVAEIEQSPLFRRLHQREKVIRRHRAPRTDVAAAFFELKVEQAPDRRPLNVDEVMESRDEVLGLVRQIGQDDFKKYFLFPETGVPPEAIARACGITLSAVLRINRFIDEFAVASEFHQAAPGDSGGIHYECVASIEKDGLGLFLGFSSACLARGTYDIDYARVEELGTCGGLTPSETKEARQLLRKLELINTRKNAITGILKGIVARQGLYLDSGDTRTLLPLSQRELAREVGINASTVSRAMHQKSVATPWGQEVPLRHFFLRPRRFRKEAVRQIIAGEKSLGSDEDVRMRLHDKFGVDISRRSVANIRRELKLAPLGRHRPGGSQ